MTVTLMRSSIDGAGEHDGVHAGALSGEWKTFEWRVGAEQHRLQPGIVSCVCDARLMKVFEIPVSLPIRNIVANGCHGSV
ncbi:MAG: hypothetical protein ACREVB_13690, partial [Burkholderiales bacterium]